jgi:uncharacterized membrane protein
VKLTPLIAVHMTAAIAAVAIGPFAIWARLGTVTRPKLHRAFGYAWVTLMIGTAITAIFIRSTTIINIDGYTPIHLLVIVTLFMLFLAFHFLAVGKIAKHKKTMLSLYLSACLIAGIFTLLPGRYLGNLLWK